MLCKTCLADLPAADFYASNKTRCKACVIDRVKAYRQANLEAVRAYDRMRAGQSHRVAARLAYQQTQAFAQSHSAAAKRWGCKHPKRRAAQVALNNAVRDGKVIPWPACAVPTCDRKPEAHHPDYDQPLLVSWLCKEHHSEVHAMVGEPS